MVMSMTIIWLVVAIVLGVVELMTLGLISIWFAIGAVAAMLASIAGGNIWTQLIVFIVVSGAILFSVRPIAAKYINSNVKKTNIDALVGRKLIAKTDIDNLKGIGKVDMDGSTWLAASTDDNVTIHAGEEVVITKVVGAKLIVERVN